MYKGPWSFRCLEQVQGCEQRSKAQTSRDLTERRGLSTVDVQRRSVSKCWSAFFQLAILDKPRLMEQYLVWLPYIMFTSFSLVLLAKTSEAPAKWVAKLHLRHPELWGERCCADVCSCACFAAPAFPRTSRADASERERETPKPAPARHAARHRNIHMHT